MINRKELLYYTFFILMIAAKGLGLDSGDKLYYILSALAAAAVACKLVITRYNKKEIIAMGLICSIAVLAYINSGRLGIVLSALAVVGMKDMDVRKLFRSGLFVFGVSFAVKVSAAAAGIIPNALTVHEKGGIGEIIRWGMGFSTGNVLHESYFILTAFIVYNMGKKYGLKQMCLLLSGNLLVFAFSFSYTGIIVTTFYLTLSLYAVKRKRLSKAERVLAQLPLPLCLLCSFVPPFMLGTAAGDKLNSLLQARPAFSQYFLTNQQITLFGGRMKDIPNFWIIMDNGYVYFLMTFGIAAFLLLVIGYTVTIGKYSEINIIWKSGRGSGNNGYSQQISGYNTELAMIYSFLIYGIMEQFISNAFMNISIFFIGQIFFEIMDIQKEKKSDVMTIHEKGIAGKLVEWGEKKVIDLRIGSNRVNSLKAWFLTGKIGAVERKAFIYCTAIVGGIIFLAGYLAGGTKKEYVTVPLTAVNQIEAESILFRLETAYKEKADLKEEMKRYEEIIQEEAFLNRVLSNAGEKNQLKLKSMTPEKLRNIMELSIPLQLQETKDYIAFRLRLLNCYINVPEEAYIAVLEEIAAELERMGGLEGYVTGGEIYSEIIGKSFGNERIEHIADRERYFIEKTGNIVAAEIVREGLILTLAGMLSGCIFAIIVLSLRITNKRKHN